MSFPSDDLALANRHIAEAEVRIRAQQRILQKLVRAGHDSTRAEALLDAMLVTLEQFRIHRRLIAGEPVSGEKHVKVE